MLRELPPAGPWDVKPRAGGQIEVEFIAQALQLIRPDAASPVTRIALANLRDAGLLSGDTAALLIRGDRIWRTVQGVLRLTAARTAPEPVGEATAEILLTTVGPALAGPPPRDILALREALARLAAQVRFAFERVLGPIGDVRGRPGIDTDRDRTTVNGRDEPTASAGED
jgi:glutamate-ammonia-ligase adenylyltransferase